MSSETGKQGRHHNRLQGLFPTWPVIPPRRDDLPTPVQLIKHDRGDTAYADRAALWKEDGVARRHSDSRILAHHGTSRESKWAELNLVSGLGDACSLNVCPSGTKKIKNDKNKKKTKKGRMRLGAAV